MGIKTRPLRDKLLYPIVAGLIAGLIVSYAVAVPARVSADTADSFFSDYFTKATQAGQRRTLYETYFTSDFRHFESWASYEGFWNPVSYATAGQAIPSPGDPLEFIVTVTFYPVNGSPSQQAIDYYLTCDSFIGSLIARITGCPKADIRIDRVDEDKSSI